MATVKYIKGIPHVAFKMKEDTKEWLPIEPQNRKEVKELCFKTGLKESKSYHYPVMQDFKPVEGKEYELDLNKSIKVAIC